MRRLLRLVLVCSFMMRQGLTGFGKTAMDRLPLVQFQLMCCAVMCCVPAAWLPAQGRPLSTHRDVRQDTQDVPSLGAQAGREADGKLLQGLAQHSMYHSTVRWWL